MQTNTIMTLGASLLCGVVAVFLARGWIHGAIQSEYSKTTPITTTIKTVPVVVTDLELDFGDELTPQALRIADYPVDIQPANSFRTLDDIFTQESERIIVLSRMAANEPVLNFRISGPHGKGTLSSLIKEGMRAVSVEVDAVNGVAGFILPGDYVDVIFTRNITPNQREEKIVSDILLQNLRVLAVDQSTHVQDQTSSLAKTVTVEVTQSDAQKLHIAKATGEVNLALRRIGEINADPVGPVAFSDLETRRSKVAAKPKTPSRKSTQTSDGTDSAQITIIRGEDRDEVSVIKETDTNASELAGG